MVKSFLLGVLLTLAAGAAGGYAIIVSGMVPAATSGPALPLEHWAARTSLRATLARDAPKDPNPVPLTDDNLVAGAELYSQHCAVCHGSAKGSVPPVAAGEYPAPPQMASHGVEDDPQGWTYWKIANGVRWTGMPAWQNTLSSQQMWTLTLFLKHMDKLPPAATQAWQQARN